MAQKPTRMTELRTMAKNAGLYVATWSPGDGVTRYRFFDKPGNTYFGPQTTLCTVLGLKAAHRYVHSGQCPVSRRRRR